MKFGLLSIVEISTGLLFTTLMKFGWFAIVSMTTGLLFTTLMKFGWLAIVSITTGLLLTTLMNSGWLAIVSMMTGLLLTTLMNSGWFVAVKITTGLLFTTLMKFGFWLIALTSSGFCSTWVSRVGSRVGPGAAGSVRFGSSVGALDSVIFASNFGFVAVSSASVVFAVRLWSSRFLPLPHPGPTFSRTHQERWTDPELSSVRAVRYTPRSDPGAPRVFYNQRSEFHLSGLG